jgi:hypothetical protein
MTGASEAALADSPDAALLALAGRLKGVQTRISENEAASAACLDDVAKQNDLDRELDGLQDQFWPIVDQIAGTAATTPEGQRAKAGAARAVWLSVRGAPEQSSSTADRIIFRLICEVAGEPTASRG